MDAEKMHNLVLRLAQTEQIKWSEILIPLTGKCPPETLRQAAQQSTELGVQAAKRTIFKYGDGILPSALIQKLGCKLKEEEIRWGEQYTVAGLFTEPDRISIDPRVAQLAEKSWHDLGCSEELGSLDPFELVAAHELGHLLIYRENQRTRKKAFSLAGLLGGKHELVHSTREEAAAYSFAREYLKLPFSPNMLELLILYNRNESMFEKRVEALTAQFFPNCKQDSMC